MESLCSLTVTAHCPKCHQFGEVTFKPTQNCPHCNENLFSYIPEEKQELSQCLVCGSPHLYRQKDFNRKLGIGLVVVGVALAYFTYGISLLAVALIDLAIYKLVGEVACCYQCDTQYRGKATEIVPPFNLSLHDYYRNLAQGVNG